MHVTHCVYAKHRAEDRPEVPIVWDPYFLTLPQFYFCEDHGAREEHTLFIGWAPTTGPNSEALGQVDGVIARWHGVAVLLITPGLTMGLRGSALPVLTHELVHYIDLFYPDAHPEERAERVEELVRWAASNLLAGSKLGNHT